VQQHVTLSASGTHTHTHTQCRPVNAVALHSSPRVGQVDCFQSSPRRHFNNRTTKQLMHTCILVFRRIRIARKAALLSRETRSGDQQYHWNRLLHFELTGAQLIKFPIFFGTTMHVAGFEVPATGFCPAAGQSCPQSHTLLLHIHFNIILLSTASCYSPTQYLSLCSYRIKPHPLGSSTQILTSHEFQHSPFCCAKVFLFRCLGTT
jgi:hypothetical protein